MSICQVMGHVVYSVRFKGGCRFNLSGSGSRRLFCEVQGACRLICEVRGAPVYSVRFRRPDVSIYEIMGACRFYL